MVFFATDFLGPFQGFLITLGVPIAAWCGVFVAEVLLRRRDYAEADLYDPRGRYGSVRWTAVVLVVVGTFLGWGLVTNTFAGWLGWQGYLLGPLGGREGAWAFANLGVLVVAAGRLPGHARASPGRPSGPRSRSAGVTPARGWSPSTCRWSSPTRPAPGGRRSSTGPPPATEALLPAFADRVVCTRFVAPEHPTGAWVDYYADWPFALVPETDPLYDLVPPFAGLGGPVVSATTFGKWGPDLAAVVGRRRAAGAGRRVHRLLRAVHRPGRGRRRPARVCRRDACAGLSEADHQRALDAMALYAPLITLTTVSAVLDGQTES